VHSLHFLEQLEDLRIVRSLCHRANARQAGRRIHRFLLVVVNSETFMDGVMYITTRTSQHTYTLWIRMRRRADLATSFWFHWPPIV